MWTKDVNSLKLEQSCNLPRDHKFTLEMDQKCMFEQFESGSQLQFDM